VLVDSLILPQCVYRPGSFTGLMTIYESNYLKLARIVADLSPSSPVCESCVPDDCDLHLRILRREPYTTTLKLTYLFVEPDGEKVLDPDLTLRIYYDARLVEAVAANPAHRHPLLKELDRPQAAEELGRRWRINMMLNKWLDYLHDMGHSFR
jgi:uncharacterized protein YqiB (DUF1249 family)